MTKVKNFLSLLLLMLWVLPTTLEAEERFYIESLNIKPGQTKTFSLNLDNENSYQGFQTDIVLPEGLSIVTKANGTFDISLTDRAPSSFSLSSNEITKGTVRVVCYSSQNEVLTDKSGALVSMQIKASDSFNGGQLSLKNVIFSGLDNRDVTMNDYNLQILSVEKNSLSVSDCSLSAGQGMSIPVMLDNDTEFTAFQFDISVPDGITIDLSKSTVTSRCSSGHQLSTKDLGNGTYRFLCMSMNNDALVGNHGTFLNLWVLAADGAKGEQTITFKNVVFSDLNAKSYSLAPASFKVNVQYVAVTAVSISESSKSLYVGDTFQLKATAKPDNCSDKTIVWESSNANIAAVDDNGNVTAKASGSCNIIAYSGDRSVQASCALTIERIALTAKVQNASKVYGDENPSFAITYNGFKEGDNEADFTSKPTFTTTADTKSPVGDYEVSASGDISEKYSVTYVSGTLTVTKAPLTISAGTYSKKQGDAMPTFKATYSGFKNNETEEVLSKKPVLTTTATEASAPGEYAVTVSGAEATNYSITYEQGKLVVAAADAVIITAKNATREYGDANPALEYEVSGATLDGVPELECTAVANSPVGTYAITVKQGTVKNYNVTYVSGILTVTKAPLTISAGTYSKKQGDAMPTFKATYSGFKNNETEEVLSKKPVLTTTATEASAPGEYAVTVSGAEATNYSITYEQGKLVVAAADAVIITAKNVTREYGEANPTLEYEVSGATLDGVPELECTAVANSPVGTYAITVKQGTVKNYNVTYVAGTLTVTKAPLTISASTYSKKQGEAMPTFKAMYSGFKNNETEEVLTKQPVFTTTATETSAPGEYAVNVSGAEATNYNITYEQGKLVVAAADAVIITAKNVTREYGEANPTLEYEVSGATLDGVPELECTAVANSPVGTYAITVKQGTVKNYNVTYVSGTLTVTKAPLTISAGTYSKKQGDAMPTFKATYSGFKNNETEEVLSKKPVLATTATESSAPGEYAVTVSGAEATNYSITYEQGKLVVAAADAVIITAKNVTREYGDANPTLEYEVSGATLDGVPELECTAVANSPVGTYAITVKQGTVKNYNVTYVSGTLTVTKAPLTISAGTYSKKQGDAMPTFKATYSGFKNNETEEVLTKQPELTTTATETSEPGEYEVTVSGAEAENYSITYESGKLVVSASDPEPEPEPEERTDGTVVGTDGYQSAGASFVWDATIDWATQRLVASIDVSGCTGKYENLLSVGDKIEDWCGNHVHIYYTRNDAGTGGNVLVYYMNAIDAISCATFDMDGDDLRIIISKKKGITVNGKSFNYKFADYFTNGGDPITDTSGFYAALWALSDIQVGSQEGGTRSNATYNYIRVQDLVSPTEPDPEPDPEPEERKDGTVIGTDGYQPAGASFVWNASIDWETQKLVASIDVSTCLSSTTCENILSVGSDISSWADGEKFHIYYTQSSKTLTIWYIDNWEYKIQHKEVSVSDDVLRVEISKEKGLVVNGEDFNDGNDVATTYEELWKLSDIQVGSQEGVNRSNATYNYIRVQDLIKPDVPTAINAAALNGEADIYTLSGVKVNELQKGINIVRMNGKTMKIVKR